MTLSLKSKTLETHAHKLVISSELTLSEVISIDSMTTINYHSNLSLDVIAEHILNAKKNDQLPDILTPLQKRMQSGG